MLALLLALDAIPPTTADRGPAPTPAAVVAPAAAPAAPPLPAPVTRAEWAQYRIAFGILGQLGELTVVLTPGAREADPARLLGQVKASLFGIGDTEKRVLSEFDARTLGAPRWTAYRWTSGKIVTDFARQTAPGTVALVRRRPGKPDQPETLRRAAGVIDPLGFLMRLRVSVPRQPQQHEVLDHHGLWQVVVGPARQVTGDMGRALRIEAQAHPIYWDGSRDEDRPRRSFTLWLSDDEFRTPVRLVMPMAVGEVRADLVTLTRSAPRPVLSAAQVADLRARIPRSLARWLGHVTARTQ